MLAEVAGHWAETRDDLLLQVLTRAGLLPSFPITARVLLALKWDHLDIALEHGAAVVALLLGACTDRDSEIASRAAQALRRLPDEAAREALCRQALEEGNAAAFAAAGEIGCAPVAPERRAMFYFLSDQWAAYEALDFDRALLRAGYETATPGLRRRVLDRARQSGRVDVAEALLGGAAGLRPERMSADEWRALLDTLERTEAWGRLWALVREAPPAWGAAVLTRLPPAGWTPPGADADEYRALCVLATGWSERACGTANPCRSTWQIGPGAVRSLAFSPTGHLLIASALENRNLHLWHPPHGEQATLPLGISASSLVFRPDGGLFAAGGDDGRVFLCDFPAVRTLDACTGPVLTLAFTPDGQTLVALTRDAVQIWDLTEHEAEAKLRELSGGLTCCAVSPDGEVLATGTDDGRVWLSWHLPHGELQDALVGHAAPITSLDFASDGRTLASTDRGGTVCLWDVKSLRCLHTAHPVLLPLLDPDFQADRYGAIDRSRSRLAFVGAHPEGKTFLARTSGPRVLLWALEDRCPDRALRGHTHNVTCIAGCPATLLLASGDEAGEVRVWSLPSRLAELAHRPVAQMTLDDWDWVRDRAVRTVTPEERSSLCFLNALLKLRFQTDVQLGEPSPHVPAGAHDILLEG